MGAVSVFGDDEVVDDADPDEIAGGAEFRGGHPVRRRGLD
jgi:hypothetical protein